jgi:hypothetical protein
MLGPRQSILVSIVVPSFVARVVPSEILSACDGGEQEHQRATSSDETQDSENFVFHALKEGIDLLRRMIAGLCSVPGLEAEDFGKEQATHVAMEHARNWGRFTDLMKFLEGLAH